MEQQQELLRTYSQQHLLPATTGASQQSAGNAIGTADANGSGTAGETKEDDSEGVDELRRSEMMLEAKNARWEECERVDFPTRRWSFEAKTARREARQHLGGM